MPFKIDILWFAFWGLKAAVRLAMFCRQKLGRNKADETGCGGGEIAEMDLPSHKNRLKNARKCLAKSLVLKAQERRRH